MKKAILFFLLLVICMVNVASAQRKITLKKNIFGPWKYSFNNIDYFEVGNSGKSLRYDMEGNEAAIIEMKKFKSNRIMMMITGIPGGSMVGWAIGNRSSRGQNISTETLLLIGFPLCIMSIAFQIASDGHLKKAVRIYNGEEEEIHFGLNVNKESVFGTEQISCNLTYLF